MTNKTKEAVEELQKKFNRLYRTAFYYEVVDSKSQFAELVGLTAQNLSSALSGNPRFISANLVNRAEINVKAALQAKDIDLADLYEIPKSITTAPTTEQAQTDTQAAESNITATIEQLSAENIKYKTEAMLYKDLYQRLLDHFMNNTNLNQGNEHS